MRSFCICEQDATLTAMRFGGIEGQKADENQARQLIESLIESKEIGLILVSENLHERLKDFIMEIKLTCMDTLIIMIPEPDGLKDRDYMMNYIKNSIGIKL